MRNLGATVKSAWRVARVCSVGGNLPIPTAHVTRVGRRGVEPQQRTLSSSVSMLKTESNAAISTANSKGQPSTPLPHQPEDAPPASQRTPPKLHPQIQRFNDPNALSARVRAMVDYAVSLTPALSNAIPGSWKSIHPPPWAPPRAERTTSNILNLTLDLIIAHSKNPTLEPLRDKRASDRGTPPSEGPTRGRPAPDPGVADIAVWNSFLGACAKYGLMNWAFKGYNKLKNHGHAPDSHTYLHLLSVIHASSLLPTVAAPNSSSDSRSIDPHNSPSDESPHLSRLTSLLSLLHTRNEMQNLWTSTHTNALLKYYARWDEWEALWGVWGWVVGVDVQTREPDERRKREVMERLPQLPRDPRTGRASPATRKYWRTPKEDSPVPSTTALLPTSASPGSFSACLMAYKLATAVEDEMGDEVEPLEEDDDVVRGAQVPPGSRSSADPPPIAPDLRFGEVRRAARRAGARGDSDNETTQHFPPPPTPITLHTMLAACARHGGREGALGAVMIWHRVMVARGWCAITGNSKKGGDLVVPGWRTALPDSRMVESYIRALVGGGSESFKRQAVYEAIAWLGPSATAGRKAYQDPGELPVSIGCIAVVIGASRSLAPPAGRDVGKWVYGLLGRKGGGMTVGNMDSKTARMVIGSVVRWAVEAAAKASSVSKIEDDDGIGLREEVDPQEPDHAMETAWSMWSTAVSSTPSRDRYMAATAPILDGTGLLTDSYRTRWTNRADDAWQHASTEATASGAQVHPELVLARLKFLIRCGDWAQAVRCYRDHGTAAVNEAVGDVPKVPGPWPATVSAVAKMIMAAGVMACRSCGADASGTKTDSKDGKETKEVFNSIKTHPLFSVNGGLGKWDAEMWEEEGRGKFLERGRISDRRGVGDKMVRSSFRDNQQRAVEPRRFGGFKASHTVEGPQASARRYEQPSRKRRGQVFSPSPSGQESRQASAGRYEQRTREFRGSGQSPSQWGRDSGQASAKPYDQRSREPRGTGPSPSSWGRESGQASAGRYERGSREPRGTGTSPSQWDRNRRQASTGRYEQLSRKPSGAGPSPSQWGGDGGQASTGRFEQRSRKPSGAGPSSSPPWQQNDRNVAGFRTPQQLWSEVLERRGQT
ncbi:hypothetical protein HDU93_003128 [Gonapodya sp. JEL0774]|nr:hypothetical protein HDU93_003128 [Gonapodya sp. JEL0774]